MSETPGQPQPDQDPDTLEHIVDDLDEVREDLAREFSPAARRLTIRDLNPPHESNQYTDKYTQSKPEDRLGPMRNPDDPTPEAT